MSRVAPCWAKRFELAQVLVLFVLAKLAGEDRLSRIAEWVRARQAVLRVMELRKRQSGPWGVFDDPLAAHGPSTGFLVYHQEGVLLADEKTRRNGVAPDLAGIVLRHVHGQLGGKASEGGLERRVGRDICQ